VDDELLFQEQVLGYNGAAASGPDQFGDGGKQVKKQENDIFHGFRD